VEKIALMKRYFAYFLFLSIPVISSGEPLVPSGVPFWKSKAKVYRKIREDRAIIVSVKTVDDATVKTAPKLMRLEGGGVINVPVAFAYKQAKNFKNLEKMSDHVRTAEWNEKAQTLFLHTEAFNYHARMNLAVTFTEAPEKNSINWKIIGGVFTGMEGRIEFLRNLGGGGGKESSEIGLAAGYRYNKFPIPAFFLHFGLEVVMQKIAGRMRSFIEEEFNRCNKSGSTGACA
jgi:hypothetical protein